MPSITGASRLAAILTLDIKPFLRNIEIANTRLSKFQAQAQALGSGLLRSVGLGFGLLGAGAIGVASNFSEIESQLRAIGGSTAMDPVIERARELGRTTKFTSTEVTELALSLKKLGFDAQGIQGAMTTATKLTQLFGGDLNKVGSTIAEVRRQFGLTEEEGSFERIGDVFAVAFRESALDIQNLGGALKNVGTVAAQSGLTLERTIALLGGLANQGQKAERAGTRLKTTLVRLGRELGFTEDQTGLLSSGVLDTAQIFDLLKNRAGLAGAVISQSGAEINLLEQRLINAKGALDAMSEGLSGKLFISVAKAKAGLEDMAITLGDALAPYVGAVADGLQYLAKVFDDMDDSTKDSIANFSIMAVVVPLVTTAVAGLVGAFLALGGYVALASVGIGVLVGLYTSAAVKAAKLARDQKRLNETFELFDELASTGAGGEEVEFDIANIALTSTGALEQLAARQEESLKALRTLSQETEDEITDRIEAQTNSLNSQIAQGQTLINLNTKKKDIQVQINKLIVDQFYTQRELQQREDRLRDLAEERLELQRKYARSLGFSQEILLKFQQGWDKTGDKIAQALAAFGFATNDLEQVEDKLNQIKNISLTDIVEGGPGVLKGLTEGLEGSPELLKKLNEALKKEITALGIQATTESGVKFGNTFREAAAVYAAFVEQLEKDIKLAALKKTSDEAVNMANNLKDLGLITKEQQLQQQISAITSRIQGMLGVGEGTSSDAVRILTAEVEALNAELRKAQAATALEKATDPTATFAEYVTRNFGGATAALDGFDQAAQRSAKVAKAAYADFLAGGETDEIALAEAITKFLNDTEIAELERTASGLRESLGKVPDELKEIGDDFDSGFIDRTEEATERLKVLQRQVEELKALQGLGGGTFFTEDDAKSLEQAQIQVGILQKQLRDTAKAAQLTTFIKDQVDFLGQAFLEASNSGEHFFQVLKRSFLETFRALVAKLITLIVLFTILAIVSGGTSAAAGPATQALGGTPGFSWSGLGNVLSAGFGLEKNLSVTSGSTSNPLQAERSLNITGAMSGNNIVFANQRGTRAIDRTFG